VQALKYLAAMSVSFASGLFISSAVFAFIVALDVVPRLAQKTGTEKYIKLYESALLVGGIFGATTEYINYRLYIGTLPVMLIFLCLGVFIGVLSMSLAEVLNVIPILSRRLRLHKGLFWFMLALATGKLIGSLMYFIMDGFY